jgi:hypothetical protein
MKILILLIISFNAYAYPLGIKSSNMTSKYPSLFDLGFLKSTQTGSTTTLTSLGASVADSLVIGGSLNSSALLDVQSTTKGVLFPRMTTTERTSISSPASGLTVYDTTVNSLMTYNGTNWIGAAQSANYDWTSYTPTFTGFGTATNIDCYHKRRGSDLFVKCKWTAGSSTATEARVSLPSGLTTTAFASIRSAGIVTYGTVQNGLSLYALIEPSTTYFTFGYNSSAVGSLNKRNGADFAPSGQVLSFDSGPIPVVGWSEQSNSLANIPIVPSVANSEIFSFSIGTTNASTPCSASPCSYLDQIGNNVTSVTRSGAGTYTANFIKTFAKVKCSISNSVTNTVNSTIPGGAQCNSCSSLTFDVINTATALADRALTLYCIGQI